MAEEEKVKEPSEFTQHMRAAGKATGKQIASLVPKEFWEHGREARRETLLAVRAVLDSAIERLEKPEDAKKPAPKKKTTTRKKKVDVEVEE